MSCVARPAEPPARLGWVDTGRGIAIVLVVLYHAARWLDAPGWQDANAFVSSLRMPFFFAVSGLLAVGAVRGPWAPVWRRRLSLYLWVFAAFEGIGTLAYLLGFAIRGQRQGFRVTAVALLESPVRPMYELWFLWALALFVVLAWLTRRVDPRLQLLLALVPATVALTDGFDLGNLGWNGALKYYLFFLVGLYGRTLLTRFAAAPRGTRLAVLAAWLTASVGTHRLGLLDVPGVVLGLSFLGVLAGVALAVALTGLRPLRSVGEDTLPIYVGHTPVIILVSSVAIRLAGADAVTAAGPVLVPLVALGALLVARRVGLLAAGTRWAVLYAPPAAVRDVRLSRLLSRRRRPAAPPVSTGTVVSIDD